MRLGRVGQIAKHLAGGGESRPVNGGTGVVAQRPEMGGGNGEEGMVLVGRENGLCAIDERARGGKGRTSQASAACPRGRKPDRS